MTLLLIRRLFRMRVTIRWNVIIRWFKHLKWFRLWLLKPPCCNTCIHTPHKHTHQIAADYWCHWLWLWYWLWRLLIFINYKFSSLKAVWGILETTQLLRHLPAVLEWASWVSFYSSASRTTHKFKHEMSNYTVVVFLKGSSLRISKSSVFFFVFTVTIYVLCMFLFFLFF